MSVKSSLGRQLGTQFDTVFDVVKSNSLYDKSGVIPILDLNFAKTKSLLDSRSTKNLITFSRASTGTYFGANGVLQTAATDVARFDHNPITGESLGLLIEEARTNKESGSEFHDWNVAAGSAMRYAGVSPNNTFTATMLYPSSQIQKSTIPDHTPANTYSSNWSVTFYAKPVTASTGTITFAPSKNRSRISWP